MKTLLIFSKKNLIRICAAAAAACVFATAMSVPQKATADSLSDRYADLQKQQQSVQSQLDAQNSKLKTESQKKAALDASINLIIQQTSILNSQIAATNAQIDAKNREIAATQADIDKNYDLFKQQLRAMYESGDASYVSVLLASGSFTDFLKRAEVLKVVSQRNNDIIDKLNQDQANLNTQQTALKANQTSLESSKASLASKQSAVASQIAQQAAIVSQYTDASNATKAQQSKIDSELNAIAIQIASQSSNSGSSSGVISGNPSDIVSYALQYKGCRYIFGTAGPNTFDCSGFSQWVYEHTVHIALPHSSELQSQGKDAYGNRRGFEIGSKSALRPGDLVFFEPNSVDWEGNVGAGHVGIYIGGGQMIAADNPSAGVRITDISGWSSYMYGWRFIG